SQVVKTMIKKGINVNGAEVLMLGVTFKENCPDVRNTKIVDVIRALEDYGVKVATYDPWANPSEVKHEYDLVCNTTLNEGEKYDCIILGVAHNEFLDLNLDLLKKSNAVVYDVKGIISEKADSRL
ncbi:UDP binding domain-containing protein, partial [Sphingobacterium sp.]|uniref:UDP binding domain-containing protein n=1 Tax=Sphingobacterium sp. TaxID=341027 RepID=UPI0028994838